MPRKTKRQQSVDLTILRELAKKPAPKPKVNEQELDDLEWELTHEQ